MHPLWTSWSLTRQFTFTLVLLVGAVPLSVGAQERLLQDRIVLENGTKVRLRFADRLSSATAIPRDEVRLVLSEDLKVGSAVVAKAGSPASGIIVHVRKAAADLYMPRGQIGELTVRIRSLKSAFGNTYIALSGTFEARGHSFPVATNAVIRKGQLVTVSVDGDQDMLHPF